MAKKPGPVAGSLGDTEYYYSSNGTVVDENGAPASARIATMFAAPPAVEAVAIKKTKKRLKKNNAQLAGVLKNTKYYFAPDGASIVDDRGLPAPKSIANAFLKDREEKLQALAAAMGSKTTSAEIEKISAGAPSKLSNGKNYSKIIDADIEKLNEINNEIGNSFPSLFQKINGTIQLLAANHEMIVRQLMEQNDSFQDAVIEEITGVKGPTKAGGSVPRAPSAPPKVPSPSKTSSKRVSGTRAKSVSKSTIKGSSKTLPKRTFKTPEDRAQYVKDRAQRIGEIRTEKNKEALKTLAPVATGLLGAAAVGITGAGNPPPGGGSAMSPPAGNTGTGNPAPPAVPPPASPGTENAPQAPAQGGAQQESPPGKPSSIPGMTRLSTPVSKKGYDVATQYAPNFKGLVDELESSGYKIKDIGGQSNRGGTSWHNSGMAIDINPNDNPMLVRGKDGRIVNKITGQESSNLQNPKYPFGYGKDNFGSIDAGAVAKKWGLGWGGNWKSSVDTMHFSAGANEGGGGQIQAGTPTAAAAPPAAAPPGTPTTQPQSAAGPQPSAPPGTGYPQGTMSAGPQPSAPPGTGYPQGTMSAGPQPSAPPGTGYPQAQGAPERTGKNEAAPTYSGLGSVSAKYESGGRGVDVVSSGRGDPGGVSYGAHQLASKTGTMAAYLKSPEGQQYAASFSGLSPGSPEFSAAYKQIAAQDPTGFAESQKAFITRTHYDPVAAHAQKMGYDTSDPKVQEALYSMSVQHGGAKKIVSAAGSGEGKSAEDQVKALYAQRSQYVTNLGQGNLVSRYQKEQRDVLAIDSTKLDSGNTKMESQQADLDKKQKAGQEQLAGLQKQVIGSQKQELTQEPSAPTADAGPPGAPTGAAAGMNPPGGSGEKPSTVSMESGKVDTNKVDPELMKRFYSAAKEYGKPVRINSGYRGDEYQAQLWVRGNILHEPGIHIPAKPEKTQTIAYKGQSYTVPGSGKGSKHGKGNALDISPGFGSPFQPVLAKYGITFPFGSSDAPHIQLAGGSNYQAPPDAAGGAPTQESKAAGAGGPTPAGGAPAAMAPSAPSTGGLAPMAQQNAMAQNIAACACPPMIINNTMNNNTTKTVRQGSSFQQTSRPNPGFNPLIAAAGAVVGDALRGLF